MASASRCEAQSSAVTCDLKSMRLRSVQERLHLLCGERRGRKAAGRQVRRLKSFESFAQKRLEIRFELKEIKGLDGGQGAAKHPLTSKEVQRRRAKVESLWARSDNLLSDETGRRPPKLLHGIAFTTDFHL